MGREKVGEVFLVSSRSHWMWRIGFTEEGVEFDEIGMLRIGKCRIWGGGVLSLFFKGRGEGSSAGVGKGWNFFSYSQRAI